MEMHVKNKLPKKKKKLLKTFIDPKANAFATYLQFLKVLLY